MLFRGRLTAAPLRRLRGQRGADAGGRRGSLDRSRRGWRSRICRRSWASRFRRLGGQRQAEQLVGQFDGSSTSRRASGSGLEAVRGKAILERSCLSGLFPARAFQTAARSPRLGIAVSARGSRSNVAVRSWAMRAIKRSGSPPPWRGPRPRPGPHLLDQSRRGTGDGGGDLLPRAGAKSPSKPVRGAAMPAAGGGTSGLACGAGSPRRSALGSEQVAGRRQPRPSGGKATAPRPDAMQLPISR